MNNFDLEVDLFVNYLARGTSQCSVSKDYKSAISSLKLTFNEKEAKVMNVLLRLPVLLPFIDAGLALLAPDNKIRKRLLVMLALIETNKNSHNLFIADDNAKFPLLHFFSTAVAASIKAFIGIILVSLFKWK